MLSKAVSVIIAAALDVRKATYADKHKMNRIPAFNNSKQNKRWANYKRRTFGNL